MQRNAASPRRRRSMTVGLVALLAGAVPFALRAQERHAAPEGRAFALAPKFAKGQTLRYQTIYNMAIAFKTGAGANDKYSLASGLNLTMRYRVKEVKSDGAAILAVLSEGGKANAVDEVARDLPKEADNYPRTATFDKYARIVEVKDPKASVRNAGALDGLFNQTNLLVQLHFLPLPESPVKVGDSWKVRYPLPNAGGAAQAAGGKAGEEDLSAITATLTLLGTEKVQDAETLKIKQVVNVPFEALVDAEGKAVTDPKKSAGRIAARMIFTQTVNAQPGDGQMVRSQGEIGGWVKLEGSIAQQVPGNAITISGKIVAGRLDEKTPTLTPEPVETKK